MNVFMTESEQRRMSKASLTKAFVNKQMENNLFFKWYCECNLSTHKKLFSLSQYNYCIFALKSGNPCSESVHLTHPSAHKHQ